MIANPLGRLTEDRRLTENLRYLRNLRDFLQRPNRSSFRFNFVRNPWSKNALLTQRNPMKKYPGEEWVKGGEELSQLFTSRNPSVYRGFRRFGEE